MLAEDTEDCPHCLNLLLSSGSFKPIIGREIYCHAHAMHYPIVSLTMNWLVNELAHELEGFRNPNKYLGKDFDNKQANTRFLLQEMASCL